MSVTGSMGMHKGITTIASTTVKSAGISTKYSLAFGSGLAVGALSGLVIATVGLLVVSYILDRE